MRMNTRTSSKSLMMRSVFIPPLSRSGVNVPLAAETDLPVFGSDNVPDIVHKKELGALLLTDTLYRLVAALDRALERRDKAAQKVHCIFVSLADLSERQGGEDDLHGIRS